MSAIYTYAVASAFDLSELSGVDGARVSLVRYRDIVAVRSELCDASALRTRLENLDELEAFARAHHSVVEAVAATATTIPFRLATVHSGETAIGQVLRDGYERFRATLDRLAGRVEIGVKAYADANPEHAAHADVAPTTGRDYLRQRRDLHRRQDDAWQAAGQIADRVDWELAAVAVGHHRHPPQSARLPGAPAGNVLNAAYLVEAGAAEAFADRARRLATAGVHIEVTGPWAPYSFAVPEEGP